MTCKAKALELVMRFANHSKGETIEHNLRSAQACANICVDQILKESGRFDYWNKIKKEIDLIEP